MGDVAEAPMHAVDLAGMTIDHDLKCAARAVVAGEIDAFFDLDLVLVGVETPDLFVGQHQHDALAVGQSVGFHGGMEMKANGKFVIGFRSSVGTASGHEQILAIETMRAGCEHERTLMHEAKRSA